MASLKFKRGSVEWFMFQDYWNLCQKFWIVEKNDKYWDELIFQVSQFYEKYKEITLSKGMMNALVDFLEEEYRENEKKKK